MTTCVIYGLVSSKDSKIRYIGQTKNSAQRLRQHRHRAKHPVQAVHKWMKKVYDSGYDVELKVLVEDAEVDVLETKYINKYPDLLNSRSGEDCDRGEPVARYHGSQYGRNAKAKLVPEQVTEIKKLEFL